MTKPNLAFLILLIAYQPCFAIITSTSSSTTPPAVQTDRFLNDPSFLSLIPGSSSFDFTGVGQSIGCSTNPTVEICWATMISPTLFLSATHSYPNGGAPVVFQDAAGNFITRTVATASTLAGPVQNSLGGNSDLWIGELSTAVPANVAKYSISTPTLTPATNVIQVGTQGSTDAAAAPQFRVGQNRFDGSVSNPPITAVGVSDFLLYVDNSAQGSVPTPGTPLPPVLEYETVFQGGDSGGPSFISNGGNLELVGIHSFITNLTLFTTGFDAAGNVVTTGTAVRRGSADVDVSSYQTEINTRIAAAVPEPSAALFLLLAGLLGSARACWRRTVLTAE